MEILGIGATELLFILVIAIIVLGPRDMQRAGRTIGRWLNALVRSDGWRALQRASQEIRRIPTHLMREANLDPEDLREMDRDVRRSIDPRYPPSVSRPAAPRAPTPEGPAAGSGSTSESPAETKHDQE